MRASDRRVLFGEPTTGPGRRRGDVEGGAAAAAAAAAVALAVTLAVEEGAVEGEKTCGSCDRACQLGNGKKERIGEGGPSAERRAL